MAMVANKIFHNNERKLSNGEENSDSSGQKRESGKLFSSMKVLCPQGYGQKKENSSKAPRQLNSVGNAINSRQGQNGAIFQIFGQQWKNKQKQNFIGPWEENETSI